MESLSTDCDHLLRMPGGVAQAVRMAPPDRTKIRLARGCWLRPEDVDELAARCAAAVATSADDTVVSGLTAARLHGLWLPSTDDVIHLATAEPERASRAMTRTRRPQFRAHRHQLVTEDRVIVGSVPVMSIARTWLDIARVLTPEDLVAAGDSVLRAGCTQDELAAVLDRSRRVPGVRRARLALPLLDARSRSRPETHLRLAASASDLPVLDVNEPVYRNGGGWLAEPDLSIAGARIALEYQGEDHADARRMRRDITRATDLRHEGWLCLAYGPAEVFGRPWQIRPELRRLIRARAPHLLRPARRVVS